MAAPDLINACFELFGSIVSSTSIYTLWRDKEVRGVSVWPSIFFITWGFYNLYFYSAIGQPISRIAAVLMLSVNVVWFTMAVYYKRQAHLLNSVTDFV